MDVWCCSLCTCGGGFGVVRASNQLPPVRRAIGFFTVVRVPGSRLVQSGGEDHHTARINRDWLHWVPPRPGIAPLPSRHLCTSRPSGVCVCVCCIVCCVVYALYMNPLISAVSVPVHLYVRLSLSHTHTRTHTHTHTHAHTHTHTHTHTWLPRDPMVLLRPRPGEAPSETTTCPCESSIAVCRRG